MKLLFLGLLANVFASSWFLIPSSGLSGLFNGTTSGLSLGNNLHFEKNEARCWSFWIKVNSFSDYAIYWTDRTVRGVTLSAGKDTAGGPRLPSFELYDSITDKGLAANSNTAMTLGAFEHHTISYDGSNTTAGVKFWKNNALETTVPVDQSLVANVKSATTTYIGRFSVGGIFTNAYMSNIGYFAQACSDSDNAEFYGNSTVVDLSTTTAWANKLAYYQFNSSRGDTPTTIINRATPGTVDGTGTDLVLATNTPLISNQSIKLPSSVGYVALTVINNFNWTDAFSYVIRLKTTGSDRLFLCNSNAAHDTGGYFWETRSGAQYFSMADNTGTGTERISATGTVVINDGNWHTLGIVNPGSGAAGIRFYVDGVSDTVSNTVSTLTGGNTTNTSGQNLNLGAEGNANPQPGGDVTLTQFASYTSALSAGDMAAIHHTLGKVPDLRVLASSSSLSHYWPVEGNVIDVVGSANGTATGTVYVGEAPQ